MADSADAVDALGLAELQKRAKAMGADLRFIPVDGNPLVLIKSISYFTRLYSERGPDPTPPASAREALDPGRLRAGGRFTCSTGSPGIRLGSCGNSP